VSRSVGRRTLARLLIERNEHPERLAHIDAKICAAFEHELAIFVLDMCGFSRLTLKHGIIHYLALIQRMQQVVLPLIGKRKGRLVKTEADNVFAVFDTVPQALAAAQDVHVALSEANRVLPADWDVHVGIGIGYGPLLLIDGDDVFGSEMNLASKLGEDLAEAGDILVTAAAYRKLGEKRTGFATRRAKLGALSFPYHERKRPKPRAPARKKSAR